MDNTQEQNKKQQYDWLKGYQFVKGQSGNPGGRPKGSKSLKTFAREYLETLPDEEKIEFLKTLPTEIVWKMAEGNPKQDTDVKHEGNIQVTGIEMIVPKANESENNTTANSETV